MGGLQGQSINNLQENWNEKQASSLLESKFPFFLSFRGIVQK